MPCYQTCPVSRCLGKAHVTESRTTVRNTVLYSKSHSISDRSGPDSRPGVFPNFKRWTASRHASVLVPGVRRPFITRKTPDVVRRHRINDRTPPSRIIDFDRRTSKTRPSEALEAISHALPLIRRGKRPRNRRLPDQPATSYPHSELPRSREDHHISRLTTNISNPQMSIL